MRIQRESDKVGEAGPVQSNNDDGDIIRPVSYPSKDSLNSAAKRDNLPRQRRALTPRWKAFMHSSHEKQASPVQYSPLASSSSEVISDTLEKGYGDDFRQRRATSSVKRGSFLSWNTQSAALICCIVAPVAAFTIISRGPSFLRKWRAVSDAVPYYGNFFEPDAIMALKSTSALERLKNGAVASNQAICSKIGLAILRDHGGNAIDAAVATALCVGVVNPVSSGLGGGTFIVIHSETPPKTNNLPLFHDKRDESSDHQPNNGMVTEVIDAREIAPAASTINMFVNAAEHASVIGGLAPAVPGELRGLELAHARHGRLPWSTVVAPAMELARDGFPVSPHLGNEIKKIAAKAQLLPEFPISLRKLVTKNDDWSQPLEIGEKMKNPALAQTLQAVMEKGANALYTGDLAAQWVEDVRAADGIFSLHDIESYRPTLRSPLVAEDVSGFTLVGAPPPCSGGVVIAGALRFLSGYKAPFASASDTLSVHRMVEACRHAFALRMSLSDPAFNTETTAHVVDDLIHGKFMDSLRKITKDDSTLPLSQYGGRWAQLKDNDGQIEAYDAHEGDRRLNIETQSDKMDIKNQDKMGGVDQDGQRKRNLKERRPLDYLEDLGTSHISVVDKDGNAVALTTSINAKFGSGVFSESTGILLNNQMDNFGAPAKTSIFGVRSSEVNYVKPGKKPISSMSPVLLFRRKEGAKAGEWGDLHLVVGGSGGPKIITAVLQVILNHVYRGMPLFEAVAHPRVHNQLLYREAFVTTVEQCHLLQGPSISVSNRTRQALESRNHKLLDLDYMGNVQAVAVDPETGELSAVSDIRKGGSPAGY